MSDLQAVDAFEAWWKTKPEPHIRPPRLCSLVENDAATIWLTAWRAAEQHRKEYVNTPECDQLIKQVLAMKEFDDLFELEDFAKTLLRNV